MPNNQPPLWDWSAGGPYGIVPVPGRRRKWPWVLLALVVLALAAFLLTACGVATDAGATLTARWVDLKDGTEVQCIWTGDGSSAPDCNWDSVRERTQ